jgi:hypothetical protein
VVNCCANEVRHIKLNDMIYLLFGRKNVSIFYMKSIVVLYIFIPYQQIKALVTEMMNTLISNDGIRYKKFLDSAADVFVSSAFDIPSQVVTGVPGTSHDRQHLLLEV